MLEKLLTPVRAAGAALGLVAGLSVLPGCSTTSAKATPTATPSPTATPTTCVVPFCKQLNGGQSIPFDYTHQLGLYGTAQGSPASAGVTIDGTLTWIDQGNCEIINGYTICVPLVYGSGTGKGTADICISK